MLLKVSKYLSNQFKVYNLELKVCAHKGVKVCYVNVHSFTTPIPHRG